MDGKTYRYQVDIKDPGTGQWAKDGPQAHSLTGRTTEAPQAAAEAILRNWTADAGSAPGPWRVRLWTFSATTDGSDGELVADVSSEQGPANVPEFTFVVSVAGTPDPVEQVLTCGEIAAELRRVADDLERNGGGEYPPDFSGEWHTVHPRGAVVSNAFWGGEGPYTGAYPDREADAQARTAGAPAGAYRPWLDAPWTS